MDKRFSDSKQFGKDHWSTFAYIETCCVDFKGVVARKRMRGDGHLYPTRLFGYFQDKDNDSLSLKNHNDFNCAEDLEDLGLLVTLSPLEYKITELGMEVIRELRLHKIDGGYFANFKTDKV